MFDMRTTYKYIVRLMAYEKAHITILQNADQNECI